MRNLLLCFALAMPLSASAASAPASRSIGLVLADWRPALYETADGKAECPEGLNVGEREQLKSDPRAAELLRKYGFFLHRGPHGEASPYFPQRVTDQLPFRELRASTGHGFNLDGTSDGRATVKSCRHEKFIDPAGERVDHQLARVTGCIAGWRTSGFMTEFTSEEFKKFNTGRILIEVTGVEDERNDPQVEIAIYKGRDRLVPSAAGGFVPFLTQRIDDRLDRYVSKTRGRIVDGVLISEPIPVAFLPVYWVDLPGERKLRDLTLRLKLDDTGAQGLIGGYEDLKAWWNLHSKAMSGTTVSVGFFSHPSFWRAVQRHADGYPDPVSGRCTAISAAYKVTAVRAIIAHPRPDRLLRAASVDTSSPNGRAPAGSRR